MGKKKRKQRHNDDKVIVINLDDDSSDQDESPHLYQERSRKSKKQSRKSDLTPSKVDNGDDVIDLTEQDAEESGKILDEVLLISEHELEVETRKTKKLSAYEIMRHCSNNSKDGEKIKSSKKKKRHKSRLVDKEKDIDQDHAQLKNKKSPKTQEEKGENTGIRERGERNQDRYKENRNSQGNSDSERHSSRKQNSCSISPDRLETVQSAAGKQNEDLKLRRSPRKRKNSRSRDRKSPSRDIHNNRSRSPISAKKTKQQRNDDVDGSNWTNSEQPSIYLERNQNRWGKRPYDYNYNNSSSRGRPESINNVNPQSSDNYTARRYGPDSSTSQFPKRSSDYKERGQYDRTYRRTERSEFVHDVESVDEQVEEPKNISAVSVSSKDGALLFLPHPSQYILKGKATVEVLIGSVSILGHILKDSAKSYDIFSPECNSLLKIETIAGKSNKKSVIENISSHLLETGDSLHEKLENFESTVVLKISSLKSAVFEYLTTLAPYQNLFVMGGNKGGSVNKVLYPLGISVFQRTWQPHVFVSEELRQALTEWTDCLTQSREVAPCMMVVGGKDSGKSTTNRLLINSSLNSIEGVYVLECDVGQTEFTPPGCVSLHYVTQPLLGPPFSHQRKPLCSYFFGGVSPQDDPNVYMECVQRCYQHYQQLRAPGPLIVNTMGWVKGLGLQLLVDTIRLVCPSHVIQLMCQQKHHNCDPIDSQFHLQRSWKDNVKMNSNWRQRDEPTDAGMSSRSQHKLTVIESISKSLDLNGMAVRLKAVDFRNLSLLSHLYSNLAHMTLTSADPYTVPWKDVAIHICYMHVPREQIMYALNASVVALCHADLEQTERPTEDSPMFFSSMPVCEWIGFGVIRGVDPVKKELYIVTSVDLQSLKRVNTLLKGKVTLPEQVLMKQHCHGNRMYVDDEVQSVGLSAVKPRRHMPRWGHENSAASQGSSTS